MVQPRGALGVFGLEDQWHRMNLEISHRIPLRAVPRAKFTLSSKHANLVLSHFTDENPEV